MAKRSKEERIEEDIERLDDAIELVQEVLREPIPIDVQPNVLAMAREARLKAADRIVSLLERRSKLLGLDAPESKSDAPAQSGTLADLERRLQLAGTVRSS